MRVNKKAIKALKRVMPDIQTRKAFVANCIAYNGKDFEKNFTLETTLYCRSYFYLSDEDSLYSPKKSFVWFYTKEGDGFWDKIFNSLTEEERKLKLFVK